MFSKFFIERPIFANVIAIFTVLFGLVCVRRLPVEQYPPITPPVVQVSATYPGASAEVVRDTVAAPIEQQVNGVENMIYMSSTSTADGSYNLQVTFEIGTDLDMAQVLVQNRVSAATSQLPEEVRRQGVNVRKQSPNILTVVAVTSPDNRYDGLFLANYVNSRVVDELKRIPGVGDVTVFGGSNYSMRIWADPERLEARNMTPGDLARAISEQNRQVAAGRIGGAPAPAGQPFELTVTTTGRLERAEEFGEIVVKSEGGRLTRLKDVARVELGAQDYSTFALSSGRNCANLAIYQLPGANALATVRGIRAKMEALSRSFPEGLEHEIPFDTSLFVEESVREVYRTLLEAGALVLIVILVFLQDWRAVLIPATTVPVTIVGAFAFLAGAGFSVNLLTLFGLILAIGIVVDDAIVVVENAAHHIEMGEAPKEATIRAMSEVIGPIIGITLVLMAVFLPTAFLGGITGQLYRQFALTIAATTIISAINAVTLKPAQSASYLRPSSGKPKNPLARGFNRAYGGLEGAYAGATRGLTRFWGAALIVYAGLAGLTAWGYSRLPTGFLPIEDQGYAVVAIQLPDGASLERTRAVSDAVERIALETPGVASTTVLGGYSLLDGAKLSNATSVFVVFEPWEERRTSETSLPGIVRALGARFNAEVRDGLALAFPPPAISGLGATGGFQMMLQDRGGGGDAELQRMADELVADGNGQSGLSGLNTTFRATTRQLFVNVDREKAKSLGVSLDEVFTALEAGLGSKYVNDFNRFGRTYQVRVQADARFRARPEDILRLKARNADGEMVPLGALARVEETTGTQLSRRYNMYAAASITGNPAPGRSSGDALELMESMAEAKLPPSMGYEWTGISFQERRVGGESVAVFALAVLMVYLVLAAQYESWLLPLAVLLVVPLALLGAVAGVAAWGSDNNVYTQIGIVLVIALASKNAILIVEFARELRRSGRSIRDAALEAARSRFRPILMTSFAFILGVVPLVTASGAGAASRNALGTAVFGGMIASTILAVFLVPVFYVAIQSLSERLSGAGAGAGSEAGSVESGDVGSEGLAGGEPGSGGNSEAEG